MEAAALAELARALGPVGLLVALLLGAPGVAALWLVLRYLPKTLAAFREELAAERTLFKGAVETLASRLDQIERKVDRITPAPLRVYPPHPDLAERFGDGGGADPAA